jgi:uncharacterized membrane protein
MDGWAYRFVERYRAALVAFLPILPLFSLIIFFPPDGRERAQWIQFIGRFHPLAVHLPIALMLLVPVLEIAGRWEKFAYLRLSSRFVLGLATIAAWLAAFLGWCLARSGSYSGALVTQHMWGGVSLAVICWLCWILRGRLVGPHAEKLYATALTVAVLVVCWTGYRGGQVSQGEDHLTEYMPSPLRRVLGLPSAGPLLEAATGSFYEVRVQPIFAERCVSCHGAKRQKNNLRLDSYGWLMRGGKHGAVIKPGNLEGSDLFRRITLAPDNDDFMPKEKRQALSPDQRKTIELWISAGASGDLPLDAIKNLPAGVVAVAPIEVSFPQIDAATVARTRASITSAVRQLQNRFPNILNYESQGSADLVLNASLLGAKFDDTDVEALTPVAEHIIVADFSHTAVTDRAAPAISRMKNLRVLRLAETKITDQMLRAASSLDQLQSLNVYGTGVTAAALPSLEKLAKLKHFYAGRTSIQLGVSVPQGLIGKLVL